MKPENTPIVELQKTGSIELSLKREDLIHPQISGNKYWKLLNNINNYLAKSPAHPHLISFGGAYSNHIAALAALGNVLGIRTLGIIRGDELADRFNENPTLRKAHEEGMIFRFVSRNQYRDKETLTKTLRDEFPDSLIIPEGGTNEEAVEGVRFMLTEETKAFDYLCCAVGTGGTLAGISKFAEPHQKVLGFKAVKDESLGEKIFRLSGRDNFELIDASEQGYGKFSEEIVEFINKFYSQYKIPLDPIYTAKMMRKMFGLIESNYLPQNSKILAFHTGGLQAVAGANAKLERQRRALIGFEC